MGFEKQINSACEKLWAKILNDQFIFDAQKYTNELTNNKQNKMKNWFKLWLGIKNIEQDIGRIEHSINTLKDKIYYLEKHLNISLVKTTTENLSSYNYHECSAETKYVKRKKSK